MKKRLKHIIRKLDWKIYEYETHVELEKYSPAGEDFFFCIDKKDFINNVVEYANDFDADEHAKMWVENMHTVRGIPQSIRTLINDADAIKEMLMELAKRNRTKSRKCRQ